MTSNFGQFWFKDSNLYWAEDEADAVNSLKSFYLLPFWTMDNNNNNNSNNNDNNNLFFVSSCSK